MTFYRKPLVSACFVMIRALHRWYKNEWRMLSSHISCTEHDLRLVVTIEQYLFRWCSISILIAICRSNCVQLWSSINILFIAHYYLPVIIVLKTGTAKYLTSCYLMLEATGRHLSWLLQMLKEWAKPVVYPIWSHQISNHFEGSYI